MDLFELQQRANILVQKVNDYEASLVGQEVNENDLINQHIYVDLHSLRPAMKMLFASSLSDKLSRTLFNDVPYRFYSMQPPVGLSYIEVEPDTQTSITYTGNQHQQTNNLDLWNAYNMTSMDAKINNYIDTDDLTAYGLRYVQSSNIKDALVTESQVANVFKWNTTSDVELPTNTRTTVRQVPGIVLYYLGNNYSSAFTATIPFTPILTDLNSVNYSTPPLYGAFYIQNNPTQSQVGEAMGHEACRIFLPGCNYMQGRLISPQQIWQPDRKFGEENYQYGFNWQGNAVYHELVYKDRRPDLGDSGADFTSTLNEIQDNDPQGLAIRFALAQQAPYYHNRPYFDELSPLYDSTGTKAKSLADSIVDDSKTSPALGYLPQDFVLLSNLTDNFVFDEVTGEATGFGSQDFFMLPNTTDFKGNYSYIVKFRTGSSLTTAQKIFHAEKFANLELTNAGMLTCYSWGSSTSTNLFQVSSNTEYAIKLDVTNSNTKTYSIYQNEAWMELATISDTGMDFSDTEYAFRFGLSSYSDVNPFLGTIVLSECAIKTTNDSDYRYFATQVFNETTLATGVDLNPEGPILLNGIVRGRNTSSGSIRLSTDEQQKIKKITLKLKSTTFGTYSSEDQIVDLQYFGGILLTKNLNNWIGYKNSSGTWTQLTPSLGGRYLPGYQDITITMERTSEEAEGSTLNVSVGDSSYDSVSIPGSTSSATRLIVRNTLEYVNLAESTFEYFDGTVVPIATVAQSPNRIDTSDEDFYNNYKMNYNTYNKGL